MPFDGTQRVEINVAEVTATVIDGEAILINLKTGAYYSMDGIAAEVWQLLEAGCARDVIGDHLVARYGVDAERCRSELASLCEQLLEQGIILPAGGTPARTTLPEDAPERLPEYATPRLNVYSDMADLLALDPPSPGLLDNLMRRPSPEGED